MLILAYISIFQPTLRFLKGIYVWDTFFAYFIMIKVPFQSSRILLCSLGSLSIMYNLFRIDIFLKIYFEILKLEMRRMQSMQADFFFRKQSECNGVSSGRTGVPEIRFKKQSECNGCSGGTNTLNPIFGYPKSAEK